MDNILKRNNVKVLGKGSQPMLMAHGFGCDQNMWRFLTPAFEDEYKVILFDYVGSGKSDSSAYNFDKYANLNGYAQDILDVIEALNLTDIVFVGHSVSCMTGLLAALKKPDVFEQMIFVSPSPCYINDGNYTGGFERRDIDGLLDALDSNFIGWAHYLAPVVMKNADQPALTEELTESFCAIDPKIARRFAEATFYSDSRQDLHKLSVPSLILQCTDDTIAPYEVGEYLREHTPDSTMRVMAATGHCPHLTSPDETISLIKEYLSLQAA